MTAITDGQRAEIQEKLKRVNALLEQNGAGALLLCRHENIAWITAGQVEARVAQGSETAVCQLLLTREGKRHYVVPNNEAARLADEEFAGLGYEAAVYPWHANAGECVRELAGGAALIADTAWPEAKTVSLTAMRVPLLKPEIERLRLVSRGTAAATVEALNSLSPGVSEQEMAARVAAALLERGITPTVLLMAVDERIHRYKHAVPRAGVLRRYGMLNLCARHRGLVVSITRFVHFGAMPAELAASFEAVARINAGILHATREGAISGEIFGAAWRAYAAAGAADEVQMHHQGGPCGYTERDWVITPCGVERVTDPQAFAYNPSLRGAKAEDTVVLADGKIEVLTATPELPVIEAVVDGVSYESSGVLIR